MPGRGVRGAGAHPGIGRYGYRGKVGIRLDAALERLLQQQRDRIRNRLASIEARYRRRVGELEPVRSVETRGLPQACNMEFKGPLREEYDF